MVHQPSSVACQVEHSTRCELLWGGKKLIIQSRGKRDVEIGDGNCWLVCPIEMLDALAESLQKIHLDKAAEEAADGPFPPQ